MGVVNAKHAVMGLRKDLVDRAAGESGMPRFSNAEDVAGGWLRCDFQVNGDLNPTSNRLHGSGFDNPEEHRA